MLQYSSTFSYTRDNPASPLHAATIPRIEESRWQGEAGRHATCNTPPLDLLALQAARIALKKLNFNPNPTLLAQ